MSSPDAPPAPRRRRPSSLSSIALVLVLVAGLLGYLFLREGDQVRVFVAAHDLPAFHQITQLDVRQATVEAGSVPGDAVRNRDGLVGRYTLAAVRQDRPYRRSELGPLLKPGALDKLSFVATEASPVSTLGGRLARGDRVDVLLSPTDPDATPGRLPEVLVVDVAKESVVLAVTGKNARTLLRARGSSTVALLRVGAYVAPW
ncbi:SAF domain-containing protein [Nonomuraea sp. NPDC050556]|uniref:SAF domain-containing protein n=1 Tax=Nonomuraea sp. NPDC050556 TaxID=3364369 RepID=UPI0037AC6A89